MNSFRFLKLFSILTISFFSFLDLAAAQTQSLSPDGVSITPFLQEINIQPGQSSKQEIEISNNTGASLNVEISVADFSPSQSGHPIFSESAAENPRSLKPWFQLISEPAFTMPVGRSTVSYELNPPADLEPGTHYGAVMIKVVSPQVMDKSRIDQTLASLIFARNGQGFEYGSIQSFLSPKTLFQVEPVPFQISFQNDGNVHIRPKGELTIRNIFGQPVAILPVNRDANIILPDSDRLFQAAWQPNFALGYYSAELRLSYGDQSTELIQRRSIYVWPLAWIIIAFSGLVAVLVLGWQLLRLYQRYILHRSRE